MSINWKAVARRFRSQRDDALAEHTRLVLANALTTFQRRNAEQAAKEDVPASATDLLLRRLGTIDSGEAFRQYADISLNHLVIVEHEFERRFPQDYKQWATAIDLGK